MIEFDQNDDGWGPKDDTDSILNFLPFSNYNTKDRLGRVADWNVNHLDVRENDDEAFRVVEARALPPKQRSKWNYKSWNRNQPTNNRKRFDKDKRDTKMRAQDFHKWGNRRGIFGKAKRYWGNWDRGRWDRRDQNPNPQSIAVMEDWSLFSESIVTEMSSVKILVPVGSDLTMCGILHHCDPSFDLLTTKNAVPLKRFSKIEFFNVTTSDDPVLQRLSATNTGNVYATSSILSLFMAIGKSVAPWDVVVSKKDGNIFFDKRASSLVDLLTVNETGHEPNVPNIDSPNHKHNLSIEASMINQNFSQQILASAEAFPPIEFDEPNPFAGSLPEDTQAARVAYKYRKIEFDGISLVVRCEVSAYEDRGHSRDFIIINALNEFDAKISGSVDWQQKLDSQRAAILATEMSNNAYKMGRWLAEASLAGVDTMKLGFVSRLNSKNASRHTIMGTSRYKCADLRRQLGLSESTMYGALKEVVDHFKSLDDGMYLLVRDANDPKLLFYELPSSISMSALEARNIDPADITDL